MTFHLSTQLHELQTPGRGQEPGVTGQVFYVIAEVLLHKISQSSQSGTVKIFFRRSFRININCRQYMHGIHMSIL